MKKFILLSALLAVTVVLHAQRVTLSEETFGTTPWDTDGPGGGGGFPTHWKHGSITTFSSTNGDIEGGQDQSVRINSYSDNDAISDAASDMHVVLTPSSLNSGSWDTLYFRNIDITGGYHSFEVTFDYAIWKGVGGDTTAYKQSVRCLNVQVRIDGGDWTQLDTTKIPLIPSDTSVEVTLAVKHAKGANYNGNTMDIRFAKRAKYNQTVLDNIKLTALKNPFTRISRETFGTKAWDTNGPGGGGGFATHWKSSSVNTFTSTNGFIEGGSDLSIRINNSVDGNGLSAENDDMHVHMTSPYEYSGSWDTLYFKGIDITGFQGFRVDFEHSKRSFTSNGAVFPVSTDINGLNVEVRIDGGSWIQLDTTMIPKVAPGAYSKVQLVVPDSSLEGTFADIRISKVGRYNQNALDNIELMGRSKSQIQFIDELFVLGPGGATSGLTISEDNKTMQFRAVVLPTNATLSDVVWSVTDESLGTVSRTGLFTPRKNGRVGVIATSLDYDEDLTGFWGPMDDTVWIDLTNQIVPVTSIDIAPADTTLVTSFGQTIQFAATVLPADATDRTVIWSVVDKNGASVDYGRIDAAGLFTPGFRSIDTIYVVGTTVDGGKTDKELVTINLPVVGAEGEKDLDIKIHPNAVSDVVYVEGDKIHQVRMINLQGSVVRSVENNVLRKKKIAVDVSGISPGFYLVTVSTLDGKVVTKKIAKK